MTLTYSFFIPHTEELDRLCRVSNNLYNQALYLFRQTLKNEDCVTYAKNRILFNNLNILIT